MIQNVTNFQGEYPSDGYHLFEFAMGDLIVTNDEEAYEEHKEYKEIKRCLTKSYEQHPKIF